jgi:hypothetical protein
MTSAFGVDHEDIAKGVCLTPKKKKAPVKKNSVVSAFGVSHEEEISKIGLGNVRSFGSGVKEGFKALKSVPIPKVSKPYNAGAKVGQMGAKFKPMGAKFNNMSTGAKMASTAGAGAAAGAGGMYAANRKY